MRLVHRAKMKSVGKVLLLNEDGTYEMRNTFLYSKPLPKDIVDKLLTNPDTYFNIRFQIAKNQND